MGQHVRHGPGSKRSSQIPVNGIY